MTTGVAPLRAESLKSTDNTLLCPVRVESYGGDCHTHSTTGVRRLVQFRGTSSAKDQAVGPVCVLGLLD